MIKISVVLTTKNEGKNIGKLLDSLMNQEEPYEVLVVDSDSTDKTQDIVKKYSEKNKNIKLIIHPGTRADSMNFGVRKATGDAVSFIGGDDVADKNWIKTLRGFSASKIQEIDVITDTGGHGLEPLIYIFGKTPMRITNFLLSIF